MLCKFEFLVTVFVRYVVVVFFFTYITIYLFPVFCFVRSLYYFFVLLESPG